MAVARPEKRLYFSVLIPTLGRPAELRATLTSVLACDPAPDEVIVVDGDEARSAEAVASELGVGYLASEPGLTRQRNMGLAVATGDVVVFADDDVRLETSVFAVLAEAYGEPDVIGATVRVAEPEEERLGGPRSPLRRLVLRGSEGAFTRFGYPRYLRSADLPRDVEYMSGCFMTARRESALEIGFDEQLTGYALAEDEDFSYRLSRLGRIRYLPQATVLHLKTGFTTRDERVFGRTVVRNRAYLFRKNFRRTPLARAQFGFLVAGLVAHRLVNREWRGALGLAEGAWEALRGR
jgi:GT2 family glycosyltransferase